jgi:hypothetical protein
MIWFVEPSLVPLQTGGPFVVWVGETRWYDLSLHIPHCELDISCPPSLECLPWLSIVIVDGIPGIEQVEVA